MDRAIGEVRLRVQKFLDEVGGDEIIRFLRSYAVNGYSDICRAGLFEEIIRYIHMYKDRCYKAKPQKGGRLLCDSLETEMRITTGDLAEATRLLFEMGDPQENFYINAVDFTPSLDYGDGRIDYELNPDSYLRYHSKEEIEQYFREKKQKLNAALKFDLYAAYKQIGYSRGVRSILINLSSIDNMDSFLVYFKHYHPEISYNELYKIFQTFQEGKYDDVFFFTKQIARKDHWKKDFIEKMIEGTSTTSYMRTHYYNKDKTEIIADLNMVFDMLNL